MNELLKLLVLILACYRLSQLIALDDGPLDALLKIRIKLGVYDYDETGKAKTSLGRGLGCPYCVGMWIAIPLALYASGIVWYTIVIWLAIAGGQAFLESNR